MSSDATESTRAPGGAAAGGDAEATPGEATASLFFRKLHREGFLPGIDLEPGRVIGDFRLLALVGQGGMGQVWEAEQLSLGGRRVALKFVRPEHVTQKQLEFFQREARAGGRLHHPGLVTIHASGTSDGLAWIAMEYVESSLSVRESIDETARQVEVPPGWDREVARFVAEVAEAMQTAHAAGVIHRDLKPQNILVTPENRPKVTDFGLAKITDELALSQTGDFAGTYFYMSPEQVAARRAGIDHRTDIFSLGIILYEMLALRRPFQGDTTHQVAGQILTKEPPDPRTIRSRIPADLAVIAGKALEKDPDRRYPSMAELADDIRRHLRDEPIRAKPPTFGARLVKWAHRNPAKSGIALVAAVAFALITGLLVQSERRRSEAESRRDEVLRLSAMQDLESLVEEADVLWPAHPDQIHAYEDWIEKAEPLLADLPLHQATREEPRSLALPRREDEREHHPEFPRLVETRARIDSMSTALARRRGELAHDVPELSKRDLEAGPSVLNAWAETYFAQGLDDAALNASDAAYEAADSESKAHFERVLREMERRVELELSAPRMRAVEEEIALLRGELEALEARIEGWREWRFAEEHEQSHWWNDRLTELIDGLEALRDERTGLLSDGGISPQQGWSIPKRLAFARRLHEGFAPGGEFAERWEKALPLIHKAYPGLDIRPMMGLVPIGADPVSGLFEFWHVQSGEEPRRDARGRLAYLEDCGIVLVLLREGSFWMGAQNAESAGKNYDPEAQSEEGPVHEVRLSPFLLAKYELTQSQWIRLTGVNPSLHQPDDPRSHVSSRLCPVEQVSWNECTRVLKRADLTLPSEAQWEYGARGGTTTPWWTGAERETLRQAVNLADKMAVKEQPSLSSDWPEWNDGSVAQAPVGSLSPNRFGLHEVSGNLWELCLDGYQPKHSELSSYHDPVVIPISTDPRVIRGGSFYNTGKDSRSASRNGLPASSSHDFVGARPARSNDFE